MSPTFITLPLEVRNGIYGHVFDESHLVPYSTSHGRRRLWRRPGNGSSYGEMLDPNRLLALLEVSHQISDEATTCFYSKVRFCGELDQIAAFVKGIGARRRKLIRSVAINYRDSRGFRSNQRDTRELLGALPRLRTACITASVSDFARLQDQLIKRGIWEIDDTLLPNLEECFKNKPLWHGLEPEAQWTGGTFKRTLLPWNGRLRS